MATADVLSADEARRMFLWSQGVIGVPDRKGGVPAMLRKLGAVQLDTISVLARSHELVAYARLGAVERSVIESAYWGYPARAFEYWAHAASILPIEDWPWCALRRRAARTRTRWNLEPTTEAHREVLQILDDAGGPITTADLGGAKKGGPWWDWSPLKVAIETLLDIGAVVCVERRGFRRVYDLPERAIPAELLAHDPTDDECRQVLVEKAGLLLGVATRDDLADYFRLKKSTILSTVGDTALVSVEVEGWDEPAWAHPMALAALSEGRVRGRHRTTLLSPFDPIVWDRTRTERIFGFTHRLEAYTPAPKRVHGYFVMPVLAGGRLVGRVDPKRDGRTLVVKQVSGEVRHADAIGAAIRETAAWVGCDNIAIERPSSPQLGRRLREVVTAA